MDFNELNTELEKSLTELNKSISIQKASIETLDIPEESKKMLRGQIADMESALKNGKMDKINEVIKNLGQI
jgi:hypothetical protein